MIEERHLTQRYVHVIKPVRVLNRHEGEHPCTDA